MPALRRASGSHRRDGAGDSVPQRVTDSLEEIPDGAYRYRRRE